MKGYDGSATDIPSFGEDFGTYCSRVDQQERETEPQTLLNRDRRADHLKVLLGPVGLWMRPLLFPVVVLLLVLGVFGSLSNPDHGRPSSSPQTVTNVAMRIASGTQRFDRLLHDINAVLIAVLKQVDADPTAVDSQSARQILTELHAEFAEMQRQTKRLCRDDFGKAFLAMFQSGIGNLDAFIRTENGRLLSLFKLAARSDAQFQALLRELDDRPNGTSEQTSDFFDVLIQGHWRILAIGIISCFLFYPWRTAAVQSILFVALYALILHYLQSIDSTALRFADEFARFRNFSWSTLFHGFWGAFRCKKTSIRSSIFDLAPSFENLCSIRQGVSNDFEVLAKGVDVSIRREKTLLSYLESTTSPNDYDRQRVIGLMRNNPFSVPKMHFGDLHKRANDRSIMNVIDAAHRLQTKAIETSDSIYNVLSSGLESILTAEAVINQARLLMEQDKFSDAAELASIVAGKYSQLAAAFGEVLGDLQQVQREFESVQSARNAIVSKYRKKKLSSGLVLGASVAAVVSGFALPLIGTMGTAAVGAATAGSATVTMLTSENILGELQQFGDDLSGFREALSRIRLMVIGSQNQLAAVADLLFLIDDDLRNLKLRYEPIDSRVRHGLELFFKEALEEQAELTALLNLAPNKKPVKLDIIQ